VEIEFIGNGIVLLKFGSNRWPLVRGAQVASLVFLINVSDLDGLE